MTANTLISILLLLCSVDGNVAQLLSPSAMYHQAIHRPMAMMINPPPREDFSHAAIPDFYNNVPTEASIWDVGSCMRDALIIQKSSKTENWAKLYVDANGAKPSGFMSGNVRWLGDFDQCRNIGTIEFVSHGLSANLTSRYCRLDLIGVNQTDSGQPETITPETGSLTFGVCATTSCEIEDLRTLVDPILHDQGLKINPMKSDCILDDIPFTTMTYVALTIFSTIGALMMIGLAVDLYIRITSWYKDRQHEDDTEMLLAPPAPSTNAAASEQVGTDEEAAAVVKATLAEPPPKPFWDRLINLILCFSPYTNFTKVISVTNDSTSLTAMNGIRALSLFWVILGHVFVFVLFSLADNYTIASKMQDRISILFLFAGVFAVDTFLFLSGFFAYWSLFKRLKSLSVGSFFKSLPFIYFHRYVRLTPPFIAILLIDLGLWAHFSSGPFYFQGTDYNCATNWWTNLLYINNFVDVNHTCLGWAWYLAVDTQLFIIVPFLVYLYVKKPIFGWIACVELLLIQVICNVTLTYAYNLPSTNIEMHANITNHKNQKDSFEIFYVKPYTRMAPYIIGVMSAQLAVNQGVMRRLMNNLWVHLIMWPVMFGILLSLTYAYYDSYMGYYITSTSVDATYNALAKVAWGVAIGWLVLACAFNVAGPIGRILSWNVWQLPARLSYVAYLTHPLVMTFYVQTSRRGINVTDMTIIFMFLAFLFATFLVSIPFTLAFESPIIGLQRLLIASKSRNK